MAASVFERKKVEYPSLKNSYGICRYGEVEVEVQEEGQAVVVMVWVLIVMLGVLLLALVLVSLLVLEFIFGCRRFTRAALIHIMIAQLVSIIIEDCRCCRPWVVTVNVCAFPWW